MIRSHTTAFSEALAFGPGAFVHLDERKVVGNQVVNNVEPCVDCNNTKQEEKDYEKGEILLNCGGRAVAC
jgi:hypothetical protein